MEKGRLVMLVLVLVLVGLVGVGCGGEDMEKDFQSIIRIFGIGRYLGKLEGGFYEKIAKVKKVFFMLSGIIGGWF